MEPEFTWKDALSYAAIVGAAMAFVGLALYGMMSSHMPAGVDVVRNLVNTSAPANTLP